MESSDVVLNSTREHRYTFHFKRGFPLHANSHFLEAKSVGAQSGNRDGLNLLGYLPGQRFRFSKDTLDIKLSRPSKNPIPAIEELLKKT